jgi:hypothetical protein
VNPNHERNNGWIFAGACAGVMLMVLEAVPAELADNDWAQAYGRQDKLLGVERHLRQLCARSIRWRL